jgi:hypothetical protein
MVKWPPIVVKWPPMMISDGDCLPVSSDGRLYRYSRLVVAGLTRCSAPAVGAFGTRLSKMCVCNGVACLLDGAEGREAAESARA